MLNSHHVNPVQLDTAVLPRFAELEPPFVLDAESYRHFLDQLTDPVYRRLVIAELREQL